MRPMDPRPQRPLLPATRPQLVAVVVKVPYDSARPHAAASILSESIRAALMTKEGDPCAPTTPPEPQIRLKVLAIGPHQIHWLDEASGLCTVMYPSGSTTVLSVQPDGTVESRPQGSNGPYERAILAADRLIYAPVGPAGKMFLVPYAAVSPNPE